jgi:chorismate mutase
MPWQPSRRRIVHAALAVALLPAAVRADGDPVAVLRTILAERLGLMADIARSKWTTGAPIEDPERERALLAAGDKAAAAAGLDPASVRTLLQAQIEAAKVVQRRLFDGWRAVQQPPFPGGAELLAARRPEIARLSADLVPAFAAARAALRGCAGQAELAQRPATLADDAVAWDVAVAGATAAAGPCR